MTKLIRVLDDSFEFKLDFSKGSHNLILFEDEKLRVNLIKFVFNLCEENLKSTPYFISGFNLKPYLNLSENIYDKLGIDLEFESQKNLTFKQYCQIFNFKKFNSDFGLLNNFNKLKSIFIVSLFSRSKVILFDSIYSLEIKNYVDLILSLINKFNLFSDKIFIQIKKQVLV